MGNKIFETFYIKYILIQIQFVNQIRNTIGRLQLNYFRVKFYLPLISNGFTRSIALWETFYYQRALIVEDANGRKHTISTIPSCACHLSQIQSFNHRKRFLLNCFSQTFSQKSKILMVKNHVSLHSTDIISIKIMLRVILRNNMTTHWNIFIKLTFQIL